MLDYMELQAQKHQMAGSKARIYSEKTPKGHGSQQKATKHITRPMGSSVDSSNTCQKDDRCCYGLEGQSEGHPPYMMPGHSDEEPVEYKSAKDVATGEAVPGEGLGYVDQVSRWAGTAHQEPERFDP